MTRDQLKQANYLVDEIAGLRKHCETIETRLSGDDCYFILSDGDRWSVNLRELCCPITKSAFMQLYNVNLQLKIADLEATLEAL